MVVVAEIRWRSGEVRKFPFEVRRNPCPSSADEVQRMLGEGRPIAGRILTLSDPIDIAELGLDGEPGETIRMVEKTEYWVLDPKHRTTIHEWDGGRVGNWEPVH